MKQGSTTDRHKRDTIAILPGYLVKDFTTQDHHLERQPYDYGTSDADPPHRPQDGNHEDGDQHGEAFLCLRRGRHSWVTQAAITQTTLALACVCVCAILEMLQLHHPYLGRRQIKQRPIAACGLSPRALNGFRSERRLCSNCHSAFPCLRFHIIGCWTLSGIKALKCWLWCCKRSGIFCMESLLSRNELLCRELGVGRCVTFC